MCFRCGGIFSSTARLGAEEASLHYYLVQLQSDADFSPSTRRFRRPPHHVQNKLQFLTCDNNDNLKLLLASHEMSMFYSEKMYIDRVYRLRH